MESHFLKRANDFYVEDDNIKALAVIEESMNLVQENDMVEVNILQGYIFKALAEETENPNVKFTYWLSSVECFLRTRIGAVYSAGTLLKMAELLGSDLYFKESLCKAKIGLHFLQTFCLRDLHTEKEELEKIVRTEELKMGVSKSVVGEQKGMEEMVNSDDFDIDQEVWTSWPGLNVEIKRNFMKVPTADLKRHVKGFYGKDAEKALEQVLTYASSKRFLTTDECKNHLEQEHDAEFKPCLANDIPQRVSEVSASKISFGGWEPLDAVAAVEMIKNKLTDVKAFLYENGWSKDWPSAVDEERSKLLRDIKLLLVSFCDGKIISRSIQDRLMYFLVKKLKVSKENLIDCGLVETPQGICFLECEELNQILAFLRKVKCERHDGTVLVCRAVDSLCGGTRYREKIDFDTEFSVLLLDKRLLQCKVTRFDDESTINVFDPTVHYDKSPATGDAFLSWLKDYSSGVRGFRFPRPIREHNLGIWVAVLRAVQFTCRTLRTKYAKKFQLLDYDAALNDAKNLCISEDEKRNSLQKDNWTRYALVLFHRCEEEAPNNIFLCAVRDVLKESSYPTFDSEDCMKVIGGRLTLIDDLVLKSIELLESEVNNKVSLIDSKILLIEKSRISLLNELTRLALFDYRYYIHRPLREFLLNLVDV